MLGNLDNNKILHVDTMEISTSMNETSWITTDEGGPKLN
jgi:hypothetical protein